MERLHAEISQGSHRNLSSGRALIQGSGHDLSIASRTFRLLVSAISPVPLAGIAEAQPIIKK
jgi:hypothetical protein